MKKLLILVFFLNIFFSSCSQPLAKKDRMALLEKRLAVLEGERLKQTKKKPKLKEPISIPIEKDFVLGDPNTPISMIMFVDFFCCYSGRAHRKLKKIMKDPELKKQIHVIYKHFPRYVRYNAVLAAKSALAAGQQGEKNYWAMVDELFKLEGDLKEKLIYKKAKKIGLDMNKFSQNLLKHSNKYLKKIRRDKNIGINKARIRNTPSLFIAGYSYKNNLNIKALKVFLRQKKLLNDKI